MSDSQEEAQHNLDQAGLDDSLGSALESSFTFPAPTRPAPASSAPDAVTKPGAAAPSEPVEGLDAWPGVYDSYVKSWTEEHLEARAKAEAVKEQYEAEKRKARQEEDDKLKSAEKAQRVLKEEQEKTKRLQRELTGKEDKPEATRGRAGSGQKGVREAWELVAGAEEDEEEEKASAADVRGVLPQDIVSGQAAIKGQERKPVKQPMYNPLTSTEPLPPSMQSTSNTSTPPERSPLASRSTPISQSVHSATSEAWQDISRESASSSSAEDLSPARSGESGQSGPSGQPGTKRPEDLVDIPKSSSRLGQGLTGPPPSQITPGGLSRADASSTARPNSSDQSGQPANNRTPPAQPPSLTLSLFTMPSHISFSRVMAVLGINLVLPFVNGVMLGFGEIFAREVVKVGKLVWRGERTWFSSNPSGSNRGVGSVGLSGSRGF